MGGEAGMDVPVPVCGRSRKNLSLDNGVIPSVSLTYLLMARPIPEPTDRLCRSQSDEDCETNNP